MIYWSNLERNHSGPDLIQMIFLLQNILIIIV
jgi:hypothetical protein